MSDTAKETRAIAAPCDPGAQLRTYAPDHLGDILELASLSPRLTDLAITFPGLLFALAVGYGTPHQRRTSAEMIVRGASLRDAAATVGLPFWIRKLAPQAFTAPLPRLPDTPDFGLRITNHIPNRPHRQGHWLRMVARAVALADEEFAIWLASRRDLMVLVNVEHDVAPLAVYAWLSIHAADTPIGRLIERPWAADMQLEAAVKGCDRFLFRLAIEVLLAAPIADRWAKEAFVAGYEFVPVDNAQALIEEAAEMHNCVRRYIFKIASDECRLFSVRRGNARVATLELVPSKRRGQPLIHQIKGRANGPVTRALREAAGLWRLTHAESGAPRGEWRIVPNGRLWRALVAPYETAKGIDIIAARDPSLSDLRGFITKLSGFGARAAVLLWLPEEAA